MERDLKILTFDIFKFCCKNLAVIHKQVSTTNVLKSKVTFVSSVIQTAVLTCIFKLLTMISEEFKLGKDNCSAERWFKNIPFLLNQFLSLASGNKA